MTAHPALGNTYYNVHTNKRIYTWNFERDFYTVALIDVGILGEIIKDVSIRLLVDIICMMVIQILIYALEVFIMG